MNLGIELGVLRIKVFDFSWGAFRIMVFALSGGRSKIRVFDFSGVDLKSGLLILVVGSQNQGS